MNYFKTEQGLEITDLQSYIKGWISTHGESEIFIGCDSQENGKKHITYATCICLYEKGKGAHVITKKEESKTVPMYDKLWDEVVKSVKAADELKGIETKITIHVDYNENPLHKSFQMYAAGIGFAEMNGYHALGKPESFSASYAADRHARGPKKRKKINTIKHKTKIKKFK